MHAIKKFFAITFVLIVILVSFFTLWVSYNYVVPVVMYHHVEPTEQQKANTTTPENFENQMAFLHEKGYQVITLDALIQAIKENRPLGKRTVVLTFDDGYENNYTYAWPILKKYQFPATIFIPSDFVDMDGHLSLKQIKEMMAGGISFGSHSRTHVYLPDASVDLQRYEIIESKHVLEKKLGVEIKHFAYPVGGFSDEIKEIVKKAGYESALATNRGFDRENKDVFEINRVRFSDKDNRADILLMKLSGYYNLFRKAKNPY